MSSKETFERIPSLNYRYEIDLKGNVRNAQTKHLLKRSTKKTYARLHGVYRFIIDGVEKNRTLSSLLFEVHGIEPKKTFGGQPVSVFIRKDGEAYSFRSMKQAAKFLCKKIFYSFGGIRYRLTKRRDEIDGWKIIYREPEQRKLITGAKANGDCELRRGAKNHETLRHLRN